MKLRAFDLADITRLTTILNDQQVTQYLSTKIPAPYTEKDALWWVNEGSQTGLIWAIEVDSQLVGCIGVSRGEFEYHRSGEIGYWLAKEYWRKGLASKAVSAVCQQVFDTTDIQRIFAAVFADNHGSMKVLEKQGFAQEAVLKDAIFKHQRFYDNHIFCLLRPIISC